MVPYWRYNFKVMLEKFESEKISKARATVRKLSEELQGTLYKTSPRISHL
jgi:hypothetical protein